MSAIIIREIRNRAKVFGIGAYHTTPISYEWMNRETKNIDEDIRYCTQKIMKMSYVGQNSQIILENMYDRHQ